MNWHGIAIEANNAHVTGLSIKEPTLCFALTCGLFVKKRTPCFEFNLCPVCAIEHIPVQRNRRQVTGLGITEQECRCIVVAPPDRAGSQGGEGQRVYSHAHLVSSLSPRNHNLAPFRAYVDGSGLLSRLVGFNCQKYLAFRVGTGQKDW